MTKQTTETKTKLEDNGPKKKKTKKTVDKRQEKVNKLKAIKNRQKILQRIQPGEKEKDTIEKMAQELGTYQQQINQRFTNLVTDYNGTDALVRTHDGILQQLNQTISTLAQELLQANETIDQLVDIMLEKDEDEEPTEELKEEPKEKKEKADEKE